MALAWAGVLHWLLHALGVLPDYRPVFHSIVQIQGFMTCFALGFLFTAIPRRTGTAPPSAWELGAGLALPVGCAMAAWYQRWALSQLCWLVLVLMLIQFIVRRFHSAAAARRPPTSFLWIPFSFAMGVAGSLLTSSLGLLGPQAFWLHNLGKGLLFQGLFLGLVVGIGGMILPLITRGMAPPDARRGEWLARAGHGAAAVTLAASFWVENTRSLRAGYALRGAVILTLLLVSAGLAHRPRVAGWHRRAVWLSAWLIPAGYFLGALFPAQSKAGLHVVFLGGFALMAWSVGLHVTLAHGGYREMILGRPWQVPAYTLLLLGAMILRALMEFDQARFFVWLGSSAAAFLLASLIWASVALVRLRRKDSRPGPAAGWIGADPGKGSG